MTRSDPSDYVYVPPLGVGLGLGLAGGLVGGVVGGIVSSFNTKVYIDGSQTKYKQQREKLRHLTGR